jgi:hypothetical protein
VVTGIRPTHYMSVIFRKFGRNFAKYITDLRQRNKTHPTNIIAAFTFLTWIDLHNTILLHVLKTLQSFYISYALQGHIVMIYGNHFRIVHGLKNGEKGGVD